MPNEEYYLGLDIGTNSCGWAVTDKNYNLLRAKGKDLWGVRLFEEANPASDRRSKRTARRRNERRKLRFVWLNEIFENEIKKVDPDFLQRIKYSSLYQEDKEKMNTRLNSKYSLFCDVKNRKIVYSDYDFYQEYKTIFHLRKSLLTNPAKDIRHLYLAIHSLIKHRGHFLFEGDFSQNGNVIDLLNALKERIDELVANEMIDANCQFTVPDNENIILSILKQNGLKDSKLKIKELLHTESSSAKAIAECLCNGTLALKNLFNLEEEVKLDFNSEDFNLDTALSEKGISLSDEQIVCIDKIKAIYSVLQLKKILANHHYLSEGMIGIYEQHQKDLVAFKSFIKKYYPSCYFDMFRNEQTKFTNYALYVNNDKYNHKKRVLGTESSNRTQEDFYKYVKSILDRPVEIKNYDEAEYNQLKQEFSIKMEHGQFLLKQRAKANAVMPYQIILTELRQILNVNSTKYLFLREKDASGLTNMEKIEQILTFKVPYFVGPITDKGNSEFAWAKRISNLELKPWTLDQVVDLDQAEDDFILRMINKCTYLKTQNVLPMNSILYSKFKLLNELNGLTINGEKISPSLKQEIFNNLFAEKGKVSVTALKRYLVSCGYFKTTTEISVGGIDQDFKNNFNSYAKFKTFFGKEFVDQHLAVFEKVIFYHTIITDKKRLEKRLKKEFTNLFNDEQIKYLKSLNFSKWGNLSAEFLMMPFEDKTTGMTTSIIDEMWRTDQILNQILYNPNYNLSEKLEEKTQEVKNEIIYEDIKEMYCSPAVKRGVWQSIQIVNEIRKVKGALPAKVFLEVTRHDEKKGEEGRKLSRKINLENWYNLKEFKNAVKSLDVDIAKLLDELNHKDDTELRSEKLYLYFLQLGKCAYSGEPIDLEQLYSQNVYDVDHIIPQSKIKDDSINNKVLVKRQYNMDKANNYPIGYYFPNWVNQQKGFWKILLDNNLMTQKKFDRLTRMDDLSEEELSGFIARQIVETNQSVKCVADLLKKIMPKNNIVFSKAHIVSDFRNQYEIYKSRSVNDLHHAKDAYLNIVVGNVIYNRFTDDPINFYKNKSKNKNAGITMNYKKLFDHIIYSYRTGEVVWKGALKQDENESLQHIKRIVTKNSCLVTQMAHTDYNGMFYDETIYKSKKNDANSKASITLKGKAENPLSNIEHYGGYNSAKNAFFMLVQSEDKKGNFIKTIEPISCLSYRKYHNRENCFDLLLNDVAVQNNLKNAQILIPMIKFKSKFKIGKGYYLLGGKTGKNLILHNANQFYVSNENTGYIKAIEKMMEMVNAGKKGNLLKINNVNDFNTLGDKLIISPKAKEKNKEIALTREQNLALYNLFVTKLNTAIYTETALKNMIGKLLVRTEKFITLNVYEQGVILFQILKRVGTGAAMADLSLLGENAHEGAITISQNVTKQKLRLICESVTGLFTKEIKL